MRHAARLGPTLAFSAMAMVMLGAGGESGSAGRAPAPHEHQELAARVVRLVADHFFDPRKAEAWAEAHSSYADGVDDAGELAARTRAALADLHASHTGFFTRDDAEYYGLLAIFEEFLRPTEPVEVEGIGVELVLDGLIKRVFPGGPAEAAGIRRGDRIVAAENRLFAPVASFRGRAGRPVRLLLQRTAGMAPEEVVVVPRRIDPLDEWREVQRLGTRLIEVGGVVVAYVPIFSCAGTDPGAQLEEDLAGRLAGAAALVLDLRGGWGGCDPGLAHLFDRVPSVIEQIGRDGRRSRHDPNWRKPLVVLIDGGSRSGKEALAHTIRARRLGTLVGERTAGHVLGGKPFLLPPGGLLYLAVADVLVDGIRFEGAGVEPDIVVAAALELAGGADPQLDRALELAAAAASGE